MISSRISYKVTSQALSEVNGLKFSIEKEKKKEAEAFLSRLKTITFF